MMRGYWGYPGIGTFGGDHFSGIGIAGSILMIILWVAVVAAIVLAIRALILHSRRDRPASAPEAAVVYGQAATTGRGGAPSNLLAILEERYAKGDMTRDEFLQGKADLGLGEPQAAPVS